MTGNVCNHGFIARRTFTREHLETVFYCPENNNKGTFGDNILLPGKTMTREKWRQGFIAR